MYTQRAVSTPEFPLVLRKDRKMSDTVTQLPSLSDIEGISPSSMAPLRKSDSIEREIPADPSEAVTIHLPTDHDTSQNEELMRIEEIEKHKPPEQKMEEEKSEKKEEKDKKSSRKEKRRIKKSKSKRRHTKSSKRSSKRKESSAAEF